MSEQKILGEKLSICQILEAHFLLVNTLVKTGWLHKPTYLRKPGPLEHSMQDMDLKFPGRLMAAPHSPPALSGSPAAAWLAGKSLVKSLHFLQVR